MNIFLWLLREGVLGHRREHLGAGVASGSWKGPNSVLGFAGHCITKEATDSESGRKEGCSLVLAVQLQARFDPGPSLLSPVVEL